MRKLFISAIAVSAGLLLGAAAGAEETSGAGGQETPSVVPTFLPNPLKQKTPAVTYNPAEDLKEAEMILYGELNEDKSEERRLSALERTAFGASYANSNLAISTRATGLKNITNRLSAGRKAFADGKWKEAKSEYDEVLRLLGKTYKSLLKAEVYYKIGMCEYELCNIKNATPKDHSIKVDGAMLRSSKEDLGRAVDMYKSFGQPETAAKISSFVDTFKDKASTYFLY